MIIIVVLCATYEEYVGLAAVCGGTKSIYGARCSAEAVNCDGSMI